MRIGGRSRRRAPRGIAQVCTVAGVVVGVLVAATACAPSEPVVPKGAPPSASATASSAEPGEATIPAPDPVDTGPADRASGTTVVGSDGAVTGYVVAEGDVLEAISTRYGVGIDRFFDAATATRIGRGPLAIGQELSIGAPAEGWERECFFEATGASEIRDCTAAFPYLAPTS